MDGWALTMKNFRFSEKQMAYKSGKELEKDGNRVSLFFHLATPKVDHFMAHELTLEAPPGVAAAHVYAHVVSEQGAPLRSISLLFYDHDSDRFVPCNSDNTDQPAFVMENGDTVEVRFRIDTPSKKNMDEPYCVAYEVRSHDSPGGNPQQLSPPTQRQGSTVLVRSQLTPPVYVQTKRGGTTAVPSTKAPSSPPRSSVAESEVPVVAMAAARAAAAASARALGGTSAGNNAPMVNVGGGSSSSRLDDDSSSSSSGRSTRGANRQRTEKALSYDLAVGSRGGGSVVKAEVSRSNGTRKRVDGDSGNINGRKRGRVSSQSFGDGGGNFDGGGEEPRIAALESAVDLLLSSLSEVHGKVDRLTDMMLATTRHCLLAPASSEHHAGPGSEAAAPNEASTEAAALPRSSYQSDHAASLAQLRSTLEAVTSAATTLVDSHERFGSSGGGVSGGGVGGGALTSPSSLSAVGLLESLADTALAERRAARGREMQRDMEDEGEEAVGGGSSGEDAGSAKAEHATDDRKDNNSLLRYSSLGPVRLDRDLRPDDVHAALGSLASHASLPHQHRPLRQSSLLGPPPTPQTASNEAAAAAAVHPGAESSSSGSSSCTLDDAVLLATAAMGPRQDGSGGGSSSSSSSSSILNSDGDGADGMPLGTADVVSASQEDDSLQFSQLSQDSAIRPSGGSQEGAPAVPLSDSDKSDQGDGAPGVEAPGVGTPV